MLSKAEVKIIASLKLKKFRQETGLFIVEGEKSVLEALGAGWECDRLIIRSDWYAKHDLPTLFLAQKLAEINLLEMEKMTQLSSPSPVLAVFKQRELPWSWHAGAANFVLALDQIKDPGNLGTIIRIADWFGLAGIVCSPDTVEIWNHKCLQASMGSVFRVPVCYRDLPAFLVKEDPSRVFATVLGGEDLRKTQFGDGGVVLVGSESFGLSAELRAQAGHLLTIPAFGAAESLNAAVATGIVCSWLRA
ncbi:MAG: RNA methyltransferase [Sphingobacteriaceae bacterium]|nr:RNA methyltransferase [Sphingobacteriaceae bacterium]